MRIAIIGAGNVGSALGRAWLKSGEEVVFGVPNPDRRSILYIYGSNLEYDMQTARMIVPKYLKNDPKTILYQQGRICPLIRIIRGPVLRDFLYES